MYTWVRLRNLTMHIYIYVHSQQKVQFSFKNICLRKLRGKHSVWSVPVCNTSQFRWREMYVTDRHAGRQTDRQTYWRGRCNVLIMRLRALLCQLINISSIRYINYSISISPISICNWNRPSQLLFNPVVRVDSTGLLQSRIAIIQGKGYSPLRCTIGNEFVYRQNEHRRASKRSPRQGRQ